jgi:hypothetical protein
VRVAREYNITLNLHVLRMIRANLLHDTIAARLSPGIDHVAEYHAVSRYRAKAARRRMETRFSKQFRGGANNRIFLQTEEFLQTSKRLYRRMQRRISQPVMKINVVLGKSVYSLAILFRLMGHAAIVTGIAIVLTMAFAWLTGGVSLSFGEAFNIAISNQIYWGAILLLIIMSFRTILFRMSDKEV